MTTTTPTPAAAPKKNRKRGFALIDKDRMREIASMGGRTAHANGRAHKFTSKTAKAAGSKGGQARHKGIKAAADAK